MNWNKISIGDVTNVSKPKYIFQKVFEMSFLNYNPIFQVELNWAKRTYWLINESKLRFYSDLRPGLLNCVQHLSKKTQSRWKAPSLEVRILIPLSVHMGPLIFDHRWWWNLSKLSMKTCFNIYTALIPMFKGLSVCVSVFCRLLKIIIDICSFF